MTKIEEYRVISSGLRGDLRPLNKTLFNNLPIAKLKKGLFLFSLRKPLHILAFTVNLIFLTYLIIFLQQSNKPRYVVAKSRLQVQSDLDNLKAAEEYIQRQADLHPPPPIPEFLVEEWKSKKPVLILSKNNNHKTDRDVVNFLDIFHINYLISSTLPKSHMAQVDIALIIMTEMTHMSLLSAKDLAYLKQYCLKRKIGVLVFSGTEDGSDVISEARYFNLPLQAYKADRIISYQILQGSSILRATKAGPPLNDNLPPTADAFAGFRFNHPSLRQIAIAKDEDRNVHITAVLDPGEIDGVPKVFIGYGLSFWIHNFLFVDAMHYLSNGTLSVPLERYTTVDIDDVFRGEVGNTGLTPDDVWNLINATDLMKQQIPNFRFGLLFCGSGYARHINQIDKDAHDLFLEYKEKFQWYDHTYNHINVSEAYYIQNPGDVVKEMQVNRDFAEKVGIPYLVNYFVTKAHTGVYPPVDSVYKVFNQMGVKITGSDRYAKVKKHKSHRNAGFMHQGVAVLPRVELAGINSVIEVFGDYVGGYANFLAHVYKFAVEVLKTPVSLQFIHYRNFGKDRVGWVALQKYIEILQKWTNLEVIAQEPEELVESYFKFYPEDKEPTWQHPCCDPKIRVLWDYTRQCENFPSLMLVGPEQTGSLVLAWLLNMHPAFRTANESFGEGGGIHFLDRQYQRGITWYHDRFRASQAKKPNATIVFDRTETYFQKPNIAEKALNIMYHGYAIVTLSNPIIRAFRTFKEEVAKKRVPPNLSFFSVLMSGPNAPPAVRLVRSKLIYPGLYGQYLERWGLHFKYENIIIVDGDKLLSDTQAIMDDIFDTLGVGSFDYTNKFKQSIRNMRLCKTSDVNDCVSTKELNSRYTVPSNGEKFLKTFYEKSNKILRSFMERHHMQLPDWLKN